MTYTAEQLREWAEAIESGNWPIGGEVIAPILLAHATAVEALLPAKVAIAKITARPNDMHVRRDAEITCFYAVQRALKETK